MLWPFSHGRIPPSQSAQRAQAAFARDRIAALESDNAVRWLVVVVCICLILQTILIIVLASSAVWKGTDTVKADIFKSLVDGLKALRWPLVVFGTVVVLRAPLVAIVETIVSSIVTRRISEEAEVSSMWDTGGSIEGLTTTLSSAYDQYKQPMTEQRRRDLKTFVSNAVQKGETEYLRYRNILWLHKEEGHDVAEAQSFRQCDANVEFCYSFKEATDKLQLSPDGTYDIVISHMGPEGDGFRLFDWLTQNQRRAAFFVYTRKTDDVAFRDAAQERGIRRFTNEPKELFRYVLDAVQTMPLPSSRRSTVTTPATATEDAPTSVMIEAPVVVPPADGKNGTLKDST